MAVIDVSPILNRIKAEDLPGLAPFFIRRIALENGGEQGRVNKATGASECYTFQIVSGDGELIGHSKTATLGLMDQIDGFLSLGTPDDSYGPMIVTIVGKSRRFSAPPKDSVV